MVSAMPRTFRAVTYDSITKKSRTVTLVHEDKSALGLNIVAVVEGQLCASGACAVCDALDRRIKARLRPRAVSETPWGLHASHPRRPQLDAPRTFRAVTYNPITKKSKTVTLAHDDKSALGLNIVAVVEGQLCAEGACAICDALDRRIQSRLRARASA